MSMRCAGAPIAPYSATAWPQTSREAASPHFLGH